MRADPVTTTYRSQNVRKAIVFQEGREHSGARTMSDDTNDELQRVRDAFDNVVNEAEELSDQARAEVEEAIDDLERRIDDLRGEE
ncbi:hypothetical protein JCM17092_15300 [Haloplanus litoreus]